jgi:3-methylfumaryl-CoA hydratase
MIAGGEVAFHDHVPMGVEATRKSRLLGVEEKEGRSGRLTFMRVEHRIGAGGRLLIEEEQRIVYLSAPPGSGSPSEDPPDWPWRRVFVPDELVLFRFSALTFNSHRIHYDRRYTTEVEGHPDLVVHGPLVALLLADLAYERGGELIHFTFRATSPLYVNRPVILVGRPAGPDGAELEAWSEDGRRAMVARARFNPPRAPSNRDSRPGAG